MPEEELKSRKNNQWQDIGFQGDDPSTDFRGMGILGLDQLVFFAQYDVDNCRSVLSLSRHPVGFPFAICGITITALVRELLTDELLKNHFYNAHRDSPTLDSLNQVYCRVFKLFADFWARAKPETIIQFNPVKRDFVTLLERYLAKPEANLLVATLGDLLIS